MLPVIDTGYFSKACFVVVPYTNTLAYLLLVLIVIEAKHYPTVYRHLNL